MIALGAATATARRPTARLRAGWNNQSIFAPAKTTQNTMDQPPNDTPVSTPPRPVSRRGRWV
ncbi:MAG: hypothetical protein ABL916_24100, partial [Burkholderiaceae bacterium]